MISHKVKGFNDFTPNNWKVYTQTKINHKCIYNSSSWGDQYKNWIY